MCEDYAQFLPLHPGVVQGQIPCIPCQIYLDLGVYSSLTLETELISFVNHIILSSI